METLRRIWPQLFPSATAPLTVENLPSQTGKVFIVTGGNGGIGFELVRILYGAGGTVYLAARSQDKADEAIDTITKTTSTTSGSITHLYLDLSDLSTVQSCVNTFLATSSRLDVLWNNAGVASIPLKQRTIQGLEMHIGVNCVGPYLLTQLLCPILSATARQPSTKANSVRVIWCSSILVDILAPSGGVPLDELAKPSTDTSRNYAISKTGNWFLAAELAKRFGNDDAGSVISLTQNPGNLMTGIFDNTLWPVALFFKPILYKSLHGAHTALWTGLAQEITALDNGRYAIPWGRWHPQPRQDLLNAIKGPEEGGAGTAKAFEDWCEEKTALYH